MMTVGCCRLGLLVAWILANFVSPAIALGLEQHADDRSLAAYLPSDTVLYLEISQPEAVVQKLVQHPTVAQALELDAVKPNLRGPQYLAFRAGLSLIEASLGAEWPKLVADLGGEGIAIAALPGENRFVALLQARDEAKLKKAAEALLNLSAMDAKNNGRQTPWRIEEREAGKIAVFDEFAMARRGKILAVATRTEDAEYILKSSSNHHAAKNLAESPDFRSFYQELREDQGAPDSWLWINLASLRATGTAPALTRSVSDNAAAELIFGGLLASLGANDWALVKLFIHETSIRLEGVTRFDSEFAVGRREYWFGANGQGTVPTWIPLGLQSDGMAMQLATYRDLGQWWLSKESLYTDSVVAELVQADSQLSTVFGGLDFGGEVLGAFQPGVQILVSGQPSTIVDESNPSSNRGLHIPGFAIVGQLREPRQMTRRFKVAFQSVLGFVNLGLAQNGLPQYDVDTRTIENGCECISRIWIEDDADLESPVYSFSPSLVIKDGRFVLGSDAAWVKKLADLPKPTTTGSDTNSDAVADPSNDKGGASTAPTDSHLNTHLNLDWQVIVNLLRLNRDALVAQNMIENGNSRETAGREVDHLLQALELVDGVDVTIDTTPHHLRTRLELLLSRDLPPHGSEQRQP
ncbi:MAG: hypothetical protein JNL67_18700 [Planctomycetaceae bacterium]|nr:hypothetical protein [Planctomycetaceae bacterium]